MMGKKRETVAQKQQKGFSNGKLKLQTDLILQYEKVDKLKCTD